jgi:hypothetical protein
MSYGLAGAPPAENTSVPDDIETRKLALEERRLDFEIRQYDDGNGLRKKQLSKLDQEIADLKRPFYRNPAYLTPVATILVALISGFIAFGTDLLKSNIASLVRERSNLQNQVQFLKNDQSRLDQTNRALSDQVGGLQGQIGSLQKEKDAIAAQLPFDKVQALLSVLKETSSDSLNLSDASFEDIGKLALAAGPNSSIVSFLASEYNSPACPKQLKIGLALILYKTTKNLAWKSSIRQASLDGVFDEIRHFQANQNPRFDFFYMQVLRDPNVFNLEDRREILSQMYGSIKNADINNSKVSLEIYWLATWDEEATVEYREPWLDYFSFAAKDSPSSDHISTLARVSRQAYAIRVIDVVTHSTLTSPITIVAPDKHSCMYPADIPLCSDYARGYWDVSSVAEREKNKSADPQFIVPFERRQVYADWEQHNDHLTRFWLHPEALRSLSPNLFRKIYRQEWITDDQIAHGI